MPIDANQLGAGARATLPRIRQAFIVPANGERNAQSLEQKLYLTRKDIERRAETAIHIADQPDARLVHLGDHLLIIGGRL